MKPYIYTYTHTHMYAHICAHIYIHTHACLFPWANIFILKIVFKQKLTSFKIKQQIKVKQNQCF